MDKDDVLNFRIPAELKVALRRAAAEDERSMSMMAVRILREWLTEHGFRTGPDARKVQGPRRRKA